MQYLDFESIVGEVAVDKPFIEWEDFSLMGNYNGSEEFLGQIVNMQDNDLEKYAPSWTRKEISKVDDIARAVYKLTNQLRNLSHVANARITDVRSISEHDNSEVGGSQRRYLENIQDNLEYSIREMSISINTLRKSLNEVEDLAMAYKLADKQGTSYDLDCDSDESYTRPSTILPEGV